MLEPPTSSNVPKRGIDDLEKQPSPLRVLIGCVALAVDQWQREEFCRFAPIRNQISKGFPWLSAVLAYKEHKLLFIALVALAVICITQ